jgi:hypothetical protein
MTDYIYKLTQLADKIELLPTVKGRAPLANTTRENVRFCSTRKGGAWLARLFLKQRSLEYAKLRNAIRGNLRK